MVTCSTYAMQVSYAVFEKKVEYSANLFADAAMDIFHLRNTDDAEPQPVWQSYLTPGVDVEAAQQSLVQALSQCVPTVTGRC